MYCTFFGLQEKPFNVTPDPRFLFLSQCHQEALGHMLYGIDERKGFIAITGEVGTGKTLLCRALLGRLGQRVRTALILNSFLSEIELLRSINADFGMVFSGTTRKELIDTLNPFLLDECRDGRNAVLIIDEAQNLAPAVLEQIRMLSNLETAQGKLLQIVLVGQPELRQHLARPELRQLNQRIALRYHLRPFDRRETSDYINHRLLVAGSHGGIRFTSRALTAIFHSTQGIARRINLLCDQALLLAYVQGTPRIHHCIIYQANAELGDQGSRRFSRVAGMRRRRAFHVAQSLFVGLALTVGGAWLGYHRPQHLEVAGSLFGTLSHLVGSAPVTPPSHDQAEAAPWPEVASAAPSAPTPPPSATESPEARRGPLELSHVADGATAVALLPTLLQAPEPTQTGLEGDTLLRALLWEYSRTPASRSESVKATLASVAASFGLEMIAIRTDLSRLKQFRLACLVETAFTVGPVPTLSILHAAMPQGIALMEASGEVRRVTDEEFTRIWSGRAYLLHRDGVAVRNILVRGHQGVDVRNLQQHLHELGYLAAKPSGVFDGETAEAVQRFQRDHALLVDGAAGPATKIMLSHLVGRSLSALVQP
jgi:general secretion pathway protein A